MRKEKMIKKYQNKEWLEKKYIEEKLSIRQIGKLSGVDRTTIGRRLRKLNITVRSNIEAMANHCNLSQEAINWISGEILGDAYLQSCSIHSARILYGSKYEEYINYVSDTLKSFGIQQSGKIYKRYDKRCNSYIYNYASLSYTELLSLRKQFYPEGKKIIPKDIKLNPTILKQHYIGDGSLIYPKNGRPYVKLATYGFPVSDVNWLVKQLNKLGFLAKRCTSNNIIGISTYSTKDFLNYIGKCPVKCYKYKFQY